MSGFYARLGWIWGGNTNFVKIGVNLIVIERENCHYVTCVRSGGSKEWGVYRMKRTGNTE